MSKTKFGVVVFASIAFSLSVTEKAFSIGDQPHWAPFNWEPAIESGCWQWNWQQYSYYDRCPRYVSPKAYLYSRGYSKVLRSKY